jgi:CRISPR/Cas system endoribonuclease Cas6 (RAMP superfamily)
MVPFYNLFETAYDTVNRDGDRDFIKNAIKITAKSYALISQKGPDNIGFTYWLFFRLFLRDNLKKLRNFRSLLSAQHC